MFNKNNLQRKKKKIINFYRLFLFSVNISLIFCSELIQECEILNSYKSYIHEYQCCKSSYVECDESESHIVSM